MYRAVGLRQLARRCHWSPEENWSASSSSYDDAERDWSRRDRVPHQRLPARRRRVRQHRAPGRGAGGRAGCARNSSSWARTSPRAEAPRDIAERAAARLRDATGCEDCDIWWLEEGYLRCLASVDENGVDEERPRQHPAPRLLPVHRAGAEDRRGPGHQLAATTSASPSTSARTTSSATSTAPSSIPLVSNDEVVGLIDLFDSRERDYNDVRWFLREAGRTVADALRNARPARRAAPRQRGARESSSSSATGSTRPGTLEELAGSSRAPARHPRGRGLRHLAGRRRRAALPRQRGQPRLGRGRGRLGARARRL